MTLRRQLMLVSLLLLALPWAGCQFVREMEGALQHGQEQSLQATTQAIATVLGNQPELLYPNPQRWQDSASTVQQLYATASAAPIIVDGYEDGWTGPIHGQWGPISYRAQTRKGRLYLFFRVTDDTVNYHDPRITTHATGDRLILRTGNGASFVIASAGPGPVQARLLENGRVQRWESRIRGQWQDTMDGFTLELEMPLELAANRLGFYLVNVSGSSSTTHGNIEPRNHALPPWLVYSSNKLQSLVKPFAAGELVLSIVDTHHWIVAQAGQLESEAEPWQQTAQNTGSATSWPMRMLYRAILNNKPQPPPNSEQAAGRFGMNNEREVLAALVGNASAGWYAQENNRQQKLLRAASPIVSDGEVVGVVLAEQNSEQYLSLTDQAFSALLLYSISAMLVSALGLLGYASWLSWRIRQLSLATDDIIAKDGSIRDNFKTSGAGDELGDLSRQYGELLGRLREYTEYLRTLSRKLSHELRTPIAVIQSSLDNLDQAPEQGQVYIQRSREGLERLNHILTAMSEASRLEESIQQSQKEELELVGFCRDIVGAYQQVYTQHHLEFICELQQCSVQAAPELLAQLLDKLFDNAASFAPADTFIRLQLTESDQGPRIRVENQGPTLPKTMQGQLFDSMVSVRDADQQGHLGLGLHIARLIAEYHNGRIYGENLDESPDKQTGVAFTLEL
jgi:two-component system, OmpR family, sensor histidine kinase ChvG